MAINSELSMSCETEGAEIRYTLDGSEPNENSTLYSNPLSLSGYTVVKAKAYKDGMTPTDVYTLEFGENKDGEEIEMIKKSFTFSGNLANDGASFKAFMGTCDCSKFISGKLFFKGSDNPDISLDIAIDVKGIGRNNIYGESYYILLDGYVGSGLAYGMIEIGNDNTFDEVTFAYGGTDSIQVFIDILNSGNAVQPTLDLYFES